MDKWVVFSKLTWVGALTVLISFLGWLGGQAFIVSNPQTVAFLGMLVGVLTVVLRFYTSQPVSFQKPPPSKTSWLLIPFLLVPVMSVSAFADESPLPERPALAIHDEQDGQANVVETSTDRFHRALIQAAVKQVRDGKMKRGELIRLRVAMLSPAFRAQAEDLAVIQMSASGSDAVPMTPDGAVDRASIDWDALLAFLEKLIPLILKLISAFGTIGRVPSFDAVQCSEFTLAA